MASKVDFSRPEWTSLEFLNLLTRNYTKIANEVGLLPDILSDDEVNHEELVPNLVL